MNWLQRLFKGKGVVSLLIPDGPLESAWEEEIREGRNGVWLKPVGNHSADPFIRETLVGYQPKRCGTRLHPSEGGSNVQKGE